jgi:hypothetical protein
VKYEFLFEDGSLLSVPAAWRNVYERRYRDMPSGEVDARLRFVAGKYFEHRAMPSKFDGIGVEATGDDRYDDPAYYVDLWDEPFRGEPLTEPPSMSQIAEEVLYQSIRSGLMQEALDDYAAEHGTKPIRVVTPEELLEEHP